MLASRVRWIVFSALIAACAPTFAGCYVDLSPPVTVDGYDPLYYDGYVVYYDTVGRPFYHVGGVPYWVPRGYVRYDLYMNHYRTHWQRYHNWYGRGGYRYRGYRR
jgi:hypothetical protein